MNKLKFLLIFLPFISFSQVSKLQTTSITGIVFNNDQKLESAVVELLNNNNERVTSTITDATGSFSINRVNILDSTFYLRASYYGMISQKSMFNTSANLSKIEFNLKEDVQLINEVRISSDQSVQNLVTKTIFDVNRYDYSRNTPSTEILNNLPSVTFDKVNGVLIDNRQSAQIFIDGMESSILFLNTLEIKDIDKIELIKTPSAKYGSEFSGGILNVITKQNGDSFLKGNINVGIGLVRESYSLFPSLSFKNKKLTVRSYLGLIDNIQEVQYSLIRKTNNNIYRLDSYKEPDIVQQSGGVDAKYDVDEGNSVFFNLSYSVISEDAVQNGNIINESSEEISFKNIENSDFQRYNTNLSYLKKINEHDELIFKTKGFWYRRNNDFILNRGNSTVLNNTSSAMNEYSGEINYDLKSRTLFKNPISYGVGGKFIYRNSFSSPGNFDFIQKLSSVFIESSYDITSKLSTYISLYAERTQNENVTQFENNYFNFLPTFIIQNKFKKDYTLKYSFDKKIKRPSIYYLNDALVYINPGLANKGNTGLEPQKEFSQKLTLSKTIKKSSVNFTTYYDYIKDAITYNTLLQDDLLINFYDNIGEVNELGSTLSIRHNLFNKINTNLSTGIQYSQFEASANESSSRKYNSGYGYSLSISSSTKLLKDKFDLSFYLNYRSPIYDLTTIRERGPYSYIRLSTNIFKEKVRVDLMYSDLFNIYASNKIKLVDPIINQTIDISNRLSNVTISFSYNFGKTFNDYFRAKKIDNKDLLSE